MASRTVPLLRLIASRSILARTQGPAASSTQASLDRVEQVLNSTEKEEEQDQTHEVNDLVSEEDNVVEETIFGLQEEEGETIRSTPVAEPDKIFARKEFSKEYWRSLISKNSSSVDDARARTTIPTTAATPTTVSTTNESPQFIPLQATITEQAYRYYAQ